MSDYAENTVYNVVVNHEEQYSIWPASKLAPKGWNITGKAGSKSECLAYIQEVWTDLRPLSLRQAMAMPVTTSSGDGGVK
jgi:MbtH protein